MVDLTRAFASVVGLLAGLIGGYHGYNEVLHGSVATQGIFINAIGPPCQGNACFPAMTLAPNFLVAGVLAFLMSLVVLVWAAVLVQRSQGGVVLILLSILLLLVGGGFLPPGLGMVAGIVGTRIKKSS